MSDRPALLFLHGVGDGDYDEKWRDALESTLTSIGYADLKAIDVIAPHYAHALKGWDEKVPLPPMTIKSPVRDAARSHRRDFEKRTAAVEHRLSSRHRQGDGWIGAEHVVDAAVYVPKFVQARNYLHDSQIRSQVLDLVLRSLPTAGELVIVGHSLGSVIAADLVLRLPVGLRVKGVVTLGSPLASNAFSVEKLRAELKDPPANVAWWVNVWNLADPVAAHRGLSSVFPWLLDLRMVSGVNPGLAHEAVTYFRDEQVAAVIGWALFGSTSRELARVERGLDVPIDEVERLGLLALRYAHLVLPHLKSDLRGRVEGALRQVQATAIAELEHRRSQDGRPLPGSVAALRVDLADAAAATPTPQPSAHLPLEEAVVLLSLLATANVLRPFEITVPKEPWRVALSELSAEIGWGTKLGQEVFISIDEVRAALSGPRKVNWVRWGTLAAGIVALVVLTGGLALAAAPGLAGAAAVTSALASFGPGGMIGGLVTAGALATAGGGGIALGLASPQTSAEALLVWVEQQLLLATVRKVRGIEQDVTTWRTLAEAEIEVRREYERMDEFSDESAPGLSDLKSKITIIERALGYLAAKGLAPSPAKLL